jgi:hypothetical protein
MIENCPQCQLELDWSPTSQFYYCDEIINDDTYKNQHIFYLKNEDNYSLYSRKGKDIISVYRQADNYFFHYYNDVVWWTSVSSYWKFLTTTISIPAFQPEDSFNAIQIHYKRLMELKAFL